MKFFFIFFLEKYKIEAISLLLVVKYIYIVLFTDRIKAASHYQLKHTTMFIS